MKAEGQRKRHLFRLPMAHRSKTSDVMLSLLPELYPRLVTLRLIMNRLGDRTFGVLLVLLSALTLIPFVSFFTGLLIALIGIQMAIGMTQLWIPNLVLDWQLPSNRIRDALKLFAPKIRALEKYIRPRWHFTEAPIIDRINGVIIFLFGVLIALPFPFINLGLAMVTIILGLGLIERDGLVQLFGFIFGVAIFALAIYFFDMFQVFAK